MKNFVFLGTVALLAACGSKPEPVAAPTETVGPVSTVAAEDAAGATTDGASDGAMTVADAGKLKTGLFDFRMGDGRTGTTEITPDGAFTMRDDKGKVLSKGTVAMKDGKTCFTPDGGKEECHQDGSVAADGSFEVTTPDGKIGKVTPHKAK